MIARSMLAMSAVAAAAATMMVAASATSSNAQSRGTTCAFRDARLAQACRTDPDIQAYLNDRQNDPVETYMDLPPVVRGWEPGEEEMVLGLIRGNQSSRQRSDQLPPVPTVNSVMRGLERLASGEYARQLEAERALKP